MRYRTLGHSGLKVSELCLGTMTFDGGEGRWQAIGQVEQDGADALVKAAVDAGVNFIDTANIYSEGASEEMTGRALKNLGIARESVVIATKAFGRVSPGPNGRGASRYHLLKAAEDSLQRLGTDHIDLYQLHGFDDVTPMEEQLEALDTLVQHGKVRYVGVSNWAAWQIAKGVGITQLRQLAPIVSLQAYYTLAGRDLEREIAPALRSEGVGLMVWSPLAGGYLAGKYTGKDADADGRRAAFDFPPLDKTRADAVVEAMRPIADTHGVSVAQIALAWLLRQDVVTSVIVGAKREEQLADNLAAVDVTLSEDELKTLGEVSALPPEYPGWMFEMQRDTHE